MSNETKIEKQDEAPGKSMDRRALIKLGTGAVVTALTGGRVLAQRGASAPVPPPGSTRPAGEPRPHTGPGYKNTANRYAGNGPMDDTTRKIVSWVHDFDESKLTEPMIKAINRTMIDSMAALIAGFEEEQVRVAARCAGMASPIGLKSTMMGYGVSTTPELAAFANGCLIRGTDFNDNGDGGHDSTDISASLAAGEAMHATGMQVMTAIAIGYEIKAAPAGGDAVAAAMAAGKLLGLDEDRLANALTIALTPHVALNKGVGAISMWKGVRESEAIKCGVWAAVLAKQGMTGPPQPYEGRGGLWSVNGKGRDFTMPVRADQMAIERTWVKRRPAEASSQGMLQIMPQIREWVKPGEIESIQYDMTDIGEISDNPKWDPHNRETADHSMPYIFARALLDGDVYLDSFKPEKFNDPAAHALMDKMTFARVNGWRGLGAARVTIRKTNGEVRSFDTYNGVRVLTNADYPHVSDDELTAKFDRVAAYMKIDNEQRDRARETWGNLRNVKDIGQAIQSLAKFGQPRPLNA